MKGMCTFCLELADGKAINAIDDFENCWCYFQVEDKTASISVPTFLNKGRITNIPPMCKVCTNSAMEVEKYHHEIAELEKKLEELRKQLDVAVNAIRRTIAGAKSKKDSLKLNEHTAKFLLNLMCYSVVGNAKSKPKRDLLLLDRSKQFSPPNSPHSSEAEEVDTFVEEENVKVKSEVSSDFGSDFDGDFDYDYQAIDTETNKSESESEFEVPPQTPSTSKRRKLSSSSNELLNGSDPEDKSNTFNLPREIPVPGRICPGIESEEEIEVKDKQNRKRQRPKKRKDPLSNPPKSIRGGKPHNQFSCLICKEKITLETNYDHMRNHVGDYVYQCPGCTIAFPSRYSATFVAKHYPPDKKYCKVAPPRKIVCEICDEDLTRGHAERHFDKHESEEKNYPCPLPSCDVTFTHRQSVEYHLRFHETSYDRRLERQRKGKEKPKHPCRTCKFCGESLRVSTSLMMEHMRNHVGDYAYQCPSKKCGMVFVSRYSIDFWEVTHRRVCDSPMPSINCETCGIEISRIRQFGPHLKRHETLEKNFDCPVASCEERFTTRQSVEFHLRSHELSVTREKNMQICSLCEYTTVKPRLTPMEMEAHFREIHQVNDILKCKEPECPFVFPNQEELLQHKISYHMKKSGRGKCDLCDSLELFYAAPLKRHYFDEHQIGSRFMCEFCNKMMSNTETLRNHIEIVHKRTSSFKCDVSECGRTFLSAQGLQTHNIKEHGAEPLKCRFCSANFNARFSLENHEKYIHLGVERPTFPCPKCSSIFKFRKGLRAHLQNIHADPSTMPDWKCSECDRMFKTEEKLSIHMKRDHDPSLRRICDLCGKILKSKTHLDVHMRIHTGERPYGCALCGLRFRQQASLYNHNKSHKRMGDKFVPKKTFDRTPSTSTNCGD